MRIDSGRREFLHRWPLRRWNFLRKGNTILHESKTIDFPRSLGYYPATADTERIKLNFPVVIIVPEGGRSRELHPIIRILSFPVYYLVHVQLSTEDVELAVEVLQHLDHHERRGCRTYRSETDDVAEEHGHVVVGLRFY